MDIFHMECCIALAEHLNYTRAAEALYVAQPVLSRIINSIENEIGFKLFDRNSRGVSITPSGEVYINGLQKVLSVYRETLEIAKLSHTSYAGTITFGTLNDGRNPLYYRIADILGKQLKNIHVEFIGCNHSKMVRKFEAGELDMILDRVSTYDSFAGEIDYIVLNRTRPCLVVPHSSEYSSRSDVRIEDLRDEKFISFYKTSSSAGNETLMKITAKGDFTPHIVKEVDSVATLLLHVYTGEGVAILTESIREIYGSELAFIPIEGMPVEEESVIWRRDNKNPAVSQAVDILCRILEEQRDIK